MSPSSTEVFANWRDPVDVHIGTRIKALRMDNGHKVSELADLLGVGLQQIARYETGSQRITASALYQLAVFLCVPIEAFFVGLPMGKPGRGQRAP
jgi:transcriptional regulator with XRE-family HTH domain